MCVRDHGARTWNLRELALQLSNSLLVGKPTLFHVSLFARMLSNETRGLHVSRVSIRRTMPILSRYAVMAWVADGGEGVGVVTYRSAT